MQISKRFKTIDEYIKTFPKNVGEKLEIIRNIVKKNAPGAVETISYNMPAFKMNGILLYFAGYENHIGLYPYPSVTSAFKNELSKYKTGKSTIQFELNKKLPVGLITKIVKFRVKEKLAPKKKIIKK